MTTSRLIAVTPRSLSESGHPSLDRLEAAGFQLVYPAPGRTPTAAELEAVVPECVGYLAGVEPVPASLLERCRDLRVITRNGVGVDNVDLEAAARLGIEVLPARGVNSQGVAELTLALAFAAARMLPWSDARLKSGRWDRSKGIELAGRTMGIVGVGQIGRRVATMAAGIGMRVVGQDSYPDPGWDAPASFEWTNLDTVLAVLGRDHPSRSGGRSSAHRGHRTREDPNWRDPDQHRQGPARRPVRSGGCPRPRAVAGLLRRCARPGTTNRLRPDRA